MADLTQKAKFAFGLNPEEIKYAAQYMGTSLNSLHLTGAENAKTMLAFQGYARQKGMEGSVFGTNFAQMLNQMGQMESKLGRNSKPMHEVNNELAQYGIHMEFFSKQGKFVGLENMLGQLEKMRVLSEKERLFVTNKLFGMEGGRIASMGIDMGRSGLQENLVLMDKQADIMQRIDTVTKSAKNTWEAFTGTVTNLLAAFGGPAVDFLKPYITKLNEITGGPLQKFIEDHKTMATVVGVGALALGTSAIAIGGIALAIGSVARAGSLFGLGKKNGAAGVLGKAAGGMPIPLPVFVVNSKMSLLPGQMGGEPNLPGNVGSPTANAGVGSKLLRGAGNLLALGTAWEIGQAIGESLHNNVTSKMDDKYKDQAGHNIAWMMALFGSKEARDALNQEKITHAKQEVSGTIHVRVDSEGRASVESVNSENKRLRFNAYVGHTMVTP
jgi:hypothetical protein